ncbi:MAG: hypothetical protein P8K68_01230 [Algibacter sp.]|uniref:hypothetical protein n=1 Tax=Algibacter sp. TaxID=1872428 RepID=UPI00260D8DBD|nr:hypothetical protein [Algibacter sp.]MDG1730433.1 hypothetical protein [Algibacter sp.]MDG2177395.1 hypothetical protein [Algibacter sp.]
MIKKSTYLLLVILFIACKSDDGVPDCSTVLCVAPYLNINLVDNSTDENLILQDNITKENILINNTSENQVEFSIINSNGFLYVEKQNPTDTLEIQINSEIVAMVSYKTTAPQTDECCDFGNLIDVEVNDKTFEVDDNTVTIYL